jgi:competence protein ComEC
MAFQDTSTAHVIAISGFNFAIVARLFVGFFAWLLGRWRGMLAAILGIALYAFLAGASAGVVRAAIMDKPTLKCRNRYRTAYFCARIRITGSN